MMIVNVFSMSFNAHYGHAGWLETIYSYVTH